MFNYLFVIKTSEEDNMSETDKIKTTLENRLRELTIRVKGVEADLSEPPDADWSDNATESANDEVLEEVEELALEEIAQIKLALSEIKAGTYGDCVKCDGKIAPARLVALPYATTCINCA